jgi:hypothetical protein
MEGLLKVATFISAHYQEIITGVVGILSGLIVICLLIPGPHPEDWLQKVVDFISKFSVKKADQK